MLRRRLGPLSAGAVVVSTLLAGCAGGPVTVHVAPASPTGEALSQCQALIKALPAVLDGQPSRNVQPDDGTTAAWGDPPFVLRCGVGKPKAFHAASPCTTVNGVDWWVPMSAPRTGSLVITTVGRSVYVEVHIPVTHLPPAGTMAELAPAISSTTTVVNACH